MTPAQAIIVDAMRAGVLLYLAGDTLRYKAIRRMPSDLAEQVKANKSSLLALLRPSPKEAPDTTDATHGRPNDLVATLRDVMAPWTLELVSDTTAAFVASNPARQVVIDLLLPVFRRDPELGIAMRDAWAERLAICTVDGGLSVEDSEQIALEELKQILDHSTSIE